MNKLAQAGFPRLAGAGYEYHPKGAIAPGAEKPITSAPLLDKLEGRLANVEYMGRELDIFDTGASNLKAVPSGKQQFDHLMNTPQFVWTGYFYVVLRRLQREQRHAALRAALAMLIAAEQGLIAEKDIVASIAPDLIQKEDLRYDDGERHIARQSQLPAA